MIASLKLQNLVDPVPELADSGVDAGLIGLRTADAPGNDAGEEEALVLPLDDHGAAGVALAGVEAAATPPGADEDVRDVFDVACGPVHGLADRVVDYGDGDFLQHAGEGPV